MDTSLIDPEKLKKLAGSKVGTIPLRHCITVKRDKTGNYPFVLLTEKRKDGNFHYIDYVTDKDLEKFVGMELISVDLYDVKPMKHTEIMDLILKRDEIFLHFKTCHN